jgi:hypothetical protein
LLAAWPWVTKHWSVYENVLRRANLDLLELSRILFFKIIQLIPPHTVIELVVDETLVRRYGPYVIGLGMHRDAVRSSHSRTAVTPGHKWVVVAIVLRLPFLHRALALPLVSALYTPKKHAKRNRADRFYPRHRTVGDLTLLLVRLVVFWAPNRRFRLLGDGAYGTHELADVMNPASNSPGLRRITLVSRFRMDAALYGAPPKYSGRGRPRLKGKRLPSPSDVASHAQTEWKEERVAWYGGKCETVQLCSRVGLWYKCGAQAKWIRWVVIRDPNGKRREEVFFTTDTTLNPKEIVEAYVRRWSLETTFQEMREHLGLETLRNRTRLAVQRSVPLLLGVFSLVVVWFARDVENQEACKRETPWHRKRSVTFSDMLAAARQDILRNGIFHDSSGNTGELKIKAPFDEPWEHVVLQKNRCA